MIQETNWKPNILRFLIAQTVSLFGSSLVQYAIIWYITLSTSSGKMLTVATLCGFLPQIFISLFAGVWIDRYQRKKLIILADTAIAIATLIAAILFMTGSKSIWILFIVLVIRAVGTGIQTPAVQSVIPQIVPKEYLMKVSGVQSTLSSMIMFLSPAISGALLSFMTLEVTLFIDVITAFIGVCVTTTVFIKPQEKMEKRENSYSKELKVGFAYVRQNRFLKYLLCYQMILLFFISPSAFLTPLMVNRTFGSEVWRLTASEMTYSLGMVLGGVLITYWGGFSKRIKTTLFAGAVYGVVMFGLAFAPFFLGYLFCNIMIGITSPCYNAPITVMIQEKVETNMQGRIFGFMQLATTCALPLGMACFGPLADVFTVQQILIFAGSIVILTTVVFGSKLVKC